MLILQGFEYSWLVARTPSSTCHPGWLSCRLKSLFWSSPSASWSSFQPTRFRLPLTLKFL